MDGVSLAVAPGQAYGLVGPDGAGKTTTMRLLVGRCCTTKAQAAKCASWEQDMQHAGPAALLHVGYLAQRFSLYEELTVQENLASLARCAACAARRSGALGRAAPIRRPGRLRETSGRAALGRHEAEAGPGLRSRSIVPGCCCWTSRPRGVDPVTRQDFWRLIIRLLTEGVAVVVSTPYMDEAARCNRLGFMYAGRILKEGSPRELMALLAGRVVLLAAQPKAPRARICLADPDVEDVAAFGDRLHLRLREGTALDGPEGVSGRLSDALARSRRPASTMLRLVPPSLEDVFIALTGSRRPTAGGRHDRDRGAGRSPDQKVRRLHCRR